MKHLTVDRLPALLLALAAAAAALAVPSGAAQAQALGPAPGITYGIGGQIGNPSGITFKFYEQPDTPWDVLAAWDLTDDLFYLNVHRMHEEPLEDSPLRYYLGPGLLLGGRGGEDDNGLIIGVSGNLGGAIFFERFEVFLQLTPRLELLPATQGALGGGGGLRYYF